MSEDRSKPEATPDKRRLGGSALHLGGLVEGTEVLTARGLVKVEDIAAGMRLVTRERGLQRVAFATQRLLPHAEVVRITPEALGASSEGSPIFVAPSQRVLLKDWRAKAMFGRARALVSVRKLIDGELIKRLDMRNARLFSLHFEASLILYAGEIELGSADPIAGFLKH